MNGSSILKQSLKGSHREYLGNYGRGGGRVLLLGSGEKAEKGTKVGTREKSLG